MAQQQSIARKRNRSDETASGHDQDLERFEQELANYLQERIKPGLNRGAIPLLARSIAHDLLSGHAATNGGSAQPVEDEQGRDDGERRDDDDETGIDFEAEMRDLQAE